MDKKTAQKLLHQHLYKTKAVPWINEDTSQRAFPFAAAFVQFALNEGADRQSVNTECYKVAALLGQVALHLRRVDLSVQTRETIRSIISISGNFVFVETEHSDVTVADNLATALAEHLSDWGEDVARGALAELFGEALNLVAQTLNCVNNQEIWEEPKPSLLEACQQAVESADSDWQLAVARALGDSTWGKQLQDIAASVLNPETRSEHWSRLKTLVENCLRQKCCQCYEPGSIRYSCGEYAGRYCDEHWETAGFRPADDRIDYLDAGEYPTEEEAY